jgi:hypothetical protein
MPLFCVAETEEQTVLKEIILIFGLCEHELKNEIIHCKKRTLFYPI